MIIRHAVPEDSRAIATIHVRSWQAAYDGLLPGELLASLSIDAREASRREQLTHARPDQRVWVVERGDRVIGFAATGESRDLDPPAAETGEVYAIYLEPDAYGTGAGRALFDRALADLRDRGYREAVVWVLESNARARRFYEAAGMHADGFTKLDEMDGFPLAEVRYRLALITTPPRAGSGR